MSTVVLSTNGKSGPSVDCVGIAEVLFGVVDVLGEGGSVGGDAEEGFAVFVSSGFGECFGDLSLWRLLVVYIFFGVFQIELCVG